MKYPDKEHIVLDWDGPAEHMVVKGNVSQSEFLEIIERYYGVDTPEFESIVQKYGQWVFGYDEYGERRHQLYDYDYSGHGKFPITIGYIK